MMNVDGPSGSSPRVRYRFPPLERRGVIAGWRAGQIGTVAAGLVVAVLAVRNHPSVPGVVVAVASVAAGVAVAFWPVAGRTGEEWLPVLIRWVRTAVAGERFQSHPGPVRGQVIAVADDGSRMRPTTGRDRGHPRASTVFGGLRLMAAAGSGATTGGLGMGVVVDDRARTVSAVLAIRGHSFALLGSVEQDARIAAWARVLASLAREGSAVHRFQWVESSLPEDGHALQSDVDRRAALGDDTRAARSYRALVEEVAPVSSRHRVQVAVTVHLGRSARTIRSEGGGMVGATAVLGREIAAVHSALAGIDVAVDGVLDRSSLSASLVEVLGTPSGDPTGGAVPGEHDDAGLSDPWPMGIEAHWDSVRADDLWHAVYWVSEWPRVDVLPDFLGPLFFAPLRRTLSVVMEPVDPLRAARQVAQARTAGVADGELRRRGGFLSSARQARERESVDDRDLELADGHAQFRFTGYLGVSADSRSGLTSACASLELAAGQSRIEVRRLFGQQDGALLTLLPLGRGLA